MRYYLLFYDVIADYVARRAEYRDEHLALARAYHSRGQLLMGGALVDPVDRAVLLFRVENVEVIEAFVAADPYVRHGLVHRWTIREWAVAVGDLNKTT